MKTRYVVGALVAVACLAVSVWLVQSTSIEYTTVAKAAEMKKRVTIKGHWNKDVDCSYDAAANVFQFVLIDDEGQHVTVKYGGSKPNNFELAESVVVKGKMESGVFMASDILTKCPSKYEGTNSMKPSALLLSQ